MREQCHTTAPPLPAVLILGRRRPSAGVLVIDLKPTTRTTSVTLIPTFSYQSKNPCKTPNLQIKI
ncbi:hypothetical protein Zm00014a_035742 [Zea mays]|uniref:Uncharacterized protein n=1 Tax=Zea mays TaxID=4577 RepID=A0A3L6G504_MAIZE|nr:hypothetical protein Zm00014a_035742 [Zea mays]